MFHHVLPSEYGSIGRCLDHLSQECLVEDKVITKDDVGASKRHVVFDAVVVLVSITSSPHKLC